MSKRHNVRHQLRRCALKIKYATFAEAEAACVEMLRVEGSVLYAYRCPYCDAPYHISHAPKFRRIYYPPITDQRTPGALRVRGMV
jgi:hypothetical protein